MTNPTTTTRLFWTVAILIALSLAWTAGATYSFPGPGQILRNVGLPDTESGIAKSLTHSEPMVRQSGATLAGDRRLARLIPDLRKLLDDDYVYARTAAAGSLLLLGDEAGAAVLANELKSSDGRIVAEAASQFARAGRQAGYHELAAVAANAEQPEYARIIAVAALGKFLPVAGLKAQVRADLRKALTSDASGRVRLAAAEAMQNDPSSDTSRAFKAALEQESDPAVRGVLLEALEEWQRKREKPE